MSNIYIYSRGAYETLTEKELKDKAIIRIHNVNDKKWYPNNEDGKLVLFFNDYSFYDLSYIEKTKATLGFNTLALNKIHTLKLTNYIKENKSKDFIIHCEYGRSRSVAVGIFIRDKIGHHIANKEDNELLSYNDWVLHLLNKLY